MVLDVRVGVEGAWPRAGANPYRVLQARYTVDPRNPVKNRRTASPLTHTSVCNLTAHARGNREGASAQQGLGRYHSGGCELLNNAAQKPLKIKIKVGYTCVRGTGPGRCTLHSFRHPLLAVQATQA